MSAGAVKVVNPSSTKARGEPRQQTDKNTAYPVCSTSSSPPWDSVIIRGTVFKSPPPPSAHIVLLMNSLSPTLKRRKLTILQIADLRVAFQQCFNRDLNI